MKKLVVAVGLAAAIAVPGFAWDVEHDEVAQLTGEFLPGEIRRFFTFDDFGVLLANCHYPDGVEGENRYRTLEETAAIVGAADAKLLAEQGFKVSGWLHRERGRAVAMGLLAKAFAERNPHNAAFYLSVLTHSISDDSALNHPPLLQFVQYSRFDGVQYPNRKVEPGAKNLFGFRSDGAVVRRIRKLLAGYEPKVAGTSFAAARDALVVDCVRQGAYAATREGLIAFGPRERAEEALAELVARQVRAILDAAWTCWTFRTDWAMPDAAFDGRIDAALEDLIRAVDPATQAVFAEIFDATLNPPNPKATVGIVCEPFGIFAKRKLSYVGRMLSAAAGRTLRDRGYAVRGIPLASLGKGLPGPDEMQYLLVDFGPGRFEDAAVRAYVKAGGRLIAVGGDDPCDVTGFGRFLKRRGNEELPVSTKWSVQNVEACKRMTVEFRGTRFPLRHNPNIDGFCKPYASNVIVPDASIVPFVTLDNGKDRFTVAARRGNVVWLSEYLLMPFVWSEDTTLDWNAMRLDSFAAEILMDAMK